MSDILGNRRVMLRYDLTTTLSNASVPYSSQLTMRGNNIYDPEYATGGGQPLGFDQWSPFFKRYTVESSRIIVKGVNLGSNATTLTLIASATVPTIVDQSHARSLPNSKQVILTSLNGMGTGTLSMGMSTARIFQLPSSHFDNDDDVYSGSFAGASPNREWEWTIFAQTMNANTLSIALCVTVEYTCTFYDPVIQQPS